MPLPCDTILQAALIVTQDDARTVIEDGAIAIHEGRIAAVGQRDAIVGNWQGATVIDMGESLIMPGLVNAHTHASMTLLRGLADDLPLMDWLTGHIFPVEKGLTGELVELGALLGCAEMLRTGTTAFSDMYLIEDATLRAVDRAGLRCLAGEAIFAFPSPAYADPETAFDLVRAQHDRWKHHARAALAVAPHAVYTSTPAILARCRDLAEELGLPIHLHLAETATETAQCIEQHGARPVPYCDGLGLLTPRTTLAHCVDLTEGEIDLLAERGVTVAHCPESNMKLASGIAPATAMLGRGMTLGLGTDGAASNNSLNMFTEMTSCALLHKVHHMDPTCAPSSAVLDMATRGGAHALHMQGIGRIEAGCPADIIALDLRAPNMQPIFNPASHLVYAATGHETRLTMVGGEVLYLDGCYTRFDMDDLLKEVRKARTWAMEQVRAAR
ncbi:amidohydrolase [Nitratidesulfovibrio vulgaris]|uniref:amidohydrolase n=1 Tax=Nitratidesulfovibrio vulgaris TaxID=881 RepID=UPI002301799B|nr:amidohydrolase [Nitratidesulfovibrio vulgaris]WCB45412.1 amidohydrolase [Nitratidesulfovibrio vulgaris]